MPKIEPEGPPWDQIDFALSCDTCGLKLNAEKGEVFIHDDGTITCNDHAYTEGD